MITFYLQAQTCVNFLLSLKTVIDKSSKYLRHAEEIKEKWTNNRVSYTWNAETYSNRQKHTVTYDLDLKP